MKNNIQGSSAFLLRLLFLSLLAIICVIPDSAFSQHLASAEKIEPSQILPQKKGDLSPLKDILSQLENQFKVNFGL